MPTQQEALQALDVARAFILTPTAKKLPKLTLPVNEFGVLSGKSDAHEIIGDDLLNYSDQWYFKNSEGTHFVCPGQDEKPARTDNSDFGRTEILDQNRFGPGDIYDPGEKKFKILQIGPKGKIVFMQIHRGNTAGLSMRPAVKFVGSEGGLIRALVKQTNNSGDTPLTFAHRFKLDEWFTAREIYKNGQLFLTVNGEEKTISVDLAGSDATFGKWGNYNNSASGRTHLVIGN